MTRKAEKHAKRGKSKPRVEKDPIKDLDTTRSSTGKVKGGAALRPPTAR